MLRKRYIFFNFRGVATRMALQLHTAFSSCSKFPPNLTAESGLKDFQQPNWFESPSFPAVAHVPNRVSFDRDRGI